MHIVTSPTERTTAATDVIITVMALGYAADLVGHQGDRWRARLWAAAFGGLGLSAGLGAVIHGVELDDTTRARLGQTNYLSLGTMIALFACGAVRDGWGERAGRRALPALLLTALGFYAINQRLQRGFLVFIAYAALAQLFALGVYVRLARGGKLDGANLIAAGILLSLLAALVQTTSLRLTIFGLPFDNNGLFHLVQIAGLPPMAAGVRVGLKP